MVAADLAALVNRKSFVSSLEMTWKISRGNVCRYWGYSEPGNNGSLWWLIAIFSGIIFFRVDADGFFFDKNHLFCEHG
jgi:hypothetical protein